MVYLCLYNPICCPSIHQRYNIIINMATEDFEDLRRYFSNTALMDKNNEQYIIFSSKFLIIIPKHIMKAKKWTTYLLNKEKEI